MMRNFNYDEDGFFTGITEARIDPEATQYYGEPRYLVPRNATHTPIPEEILESNQHWLWLNGEWVIFTEPEPEPESESEELI